MVLIKVTKVNYQDGDLDKIKGSAFASLFGMGDKLSKIPQEQEMWINPHYIVAIEAPIEELNGDLFRLVLNGSEKLEGFFVKGYKEFMGTLNTIYDGYDTY